MRLPLRTRLVTGAIDLANRHRVSNSPVERLPELRERRARMLALPGARLLTGATHRGAAAKDVALPAVPGAGLTARVYRPVGVRRDAALPLVVGFHGGGFVFGSARQSEWLCSSVAARMPAVVVSVNYRMAPEHPYPVPVDDSYAATCWVAEHAVELGGDAGNLSVMGDSAGGTLAAVVALLARDRHGPAITRQVLVYPATELGGQLPSERDLPRAPLLSAADVRAFREVYLAGADGADPTASPLRAASLAGLPPALVQTAGHDPLRDHGRRYAEALRRAGVPARWTEYVGAVHGFLSLPGAVPAARQACWEVVAFLRGELG